MLVAMLRAVGAPDVFKMVFTSMVFTRQPTSIGCDKFDLQILNAQFREIDDPQNSFVVHSVVNGHEQRTLFYGPATKHLSNVCGQFGCRNLFVCERDLTFPRNSLA